MSQEIARQSRSAFPAYGKSFITGSADGLGRMAAQLLVKQGHNAVLHARNEQRGREAMTAVPEAETVVIGDLSSVAQMKEVAAKVNALGHFAAVIHNGGVCYQSPRRVATEDDITNWTATGKGSADRSSRESSTHLRNVRFCDRPLFAPTGPGKVTTNKRSGEKSR